MPRRVCVCLLGALFAIVGCGGDATRPPISTVTGVVTLDGQPLENASVMFQPETGRPSSGTTDKEGRYTLEYSPGVPGAAEGKHTVIIRTLVPGEDGQPPVSPEKLPARYHDETELEVEVTSGNNVHNFDLTSGD